MKTKYLLVNCNDNDIFAEMMRYSGAKVVKDSAEGKVLQHNTVIFTEMCQRRWASFGVRATFVKKPS